MICPGPDPGQISPEKSDGMRHEFTDRSIPHNFWKMQPAVETEGLDPDGWLEREFRFRLKRLELVGGIELRLDFPYWNRFSSQGMQLHLNGGKAHSFQFKRGLHALQLPLEGEGSELAIEVRFENSFPLPGEDRERAARLGEIRYLQALDRDAPYLDRVSQFIVPGNPDWKNVVLVAGMSCAGKSHFIDRLTGRDSSEVRDELGILDDGPWDSLDLSTLTPTWDPKCSNLCIHYELNRGGSTVAEGVDYARDRRMWDKLAGIEKLKVVTIEAPLETLLSRHQERRHRFLEMDPVDREGFNTYFADDEVLTLLESQFEKAPDFYREWQRFGTEEGFGHRWTCSSTGAVAGILRKLI